MPILLGGAVWLVWSRRKRAKAGVGGAAADITNPLESEAGDLGDRRLVALNGVWRRARSVGDKDATMRAVAEAHDLVWAWLEKQRGSGTPIDARAVLDHVNAWAGKFEADAWPRTMAARYHDLAQRYVEAEDVPMAHSCFDLAAILQPDDTNLAYNRHLTMAALLARSGPGQNLDAAIEQATMAMAVVPGSDARTLIEQLQRMRTLAGASPRESRRPHAP